MKTTKEIAELFMLEIDRIGKGDVRKDVISGLEKCSNAIIKLARLEMDYAWKNWENSIPDLPYLSTQAKGRSIKHPERLPIASEESNGKTTKYLIVDQIVECQKKMKGSTPTLRQILSDKIKMLQNKLEESATVEAD